ncbi:hypothetical protein ISCGN_032579 [Ixodes scapularis]
MWSSMFMLEALCVIAAQYLPKEDIIWAGTGHFIERRFVERRFIEAVSTNAVSSNAVSSNTVSSKPFYRTPSYRTPGLHSRFLKLVGGAHPEFWKFLTCIAAEHQLTEDKPEAMLSSQEPLARRRP